MEKYEEYIILDEINELLKYSLSNDFNEIIKAVHERTS
jgi:superfamily II DNA/RNA helicase